MSNVPRKRLIVIHGATGIGKTALAINVASYFGCDILSCDSRQFYREMTIGTAVPSPEELAAVKHHFIHDRSVLTPLSAGEYENEALELLNKLFAHTDNAVMVGGTGLYAKAVTQGLDNLPRDTNVRQSLEQQSLEQLNQTLQSLDPTCAQTVDPNNRQRVQRAVEVCLITNQPYSTLRSGEVKQRPFQIVEIALDRPREVLYERINKRVEIMISQGLENEARQLLHLRNKTPLQTVGYREFFDYFDGHQTLEQTVRLIKQNTRHYAKRQYTWLRANQNIKWFDIETQNNQSIISFLQ